MQRDRMIAVTVWVFCVLVLALRVSSAAENEVYVPKLSDNIITVIGVVNFNGEEPLPQICPRPYICFSPNTSSPSGYAFIPFVEFQSQQPYTIHLEQGWNLISIPKGVTQ